MDAISIPEFLDYFMTPATTRHARYATSAVKNSVNMLELIQSDITLTKTIKENNMKSVDRLSTSNLMNSSRSNLSMSVSSPPSTVPQLPTNKLELALLKLVTMWETVEDILINQHLMKPNSESEPSSSVDSDSSLIETDRLHVSIPIYKQINVIYYIAMAYI